MRIHHVGIAVESLEKAVPVFELLLGLPPASHETVEDQKVRATIFQVAESRIELLEPSSPDSPVARFIGKRGPGIHHLTLTVENLQETLDNLHRCGIRLIDRNPRRGAGNESVAFLHPASTAGILIELLEEHGSGQPQPGQETGRK
ncbi:MAG: methylmalonyl-CoA epimerase [Acidobacteria bacterium]|nr:methylmalonyl-CoA epimerase [Acidobacteriota bacterium]